ncbi:MAG: GntR family transcriptional regulator [Betaproteobacteria bacterium]
MTADSLRDPTTANRIASTLAGRVLDAEIAPGARLREVPLAQEFGVSRGSIREALRILERDGVVRIEARRGAQVTRLSTDELIEIFQVRTVLLGLTMALFCDQCDDADLDWMRGRIDKMKRAMREPDPKAAAIHAEASTEMVMRALSRGGTQRLARLLTQMSAQVARYTRLGLSSAERRKQSLETWRSLVQALEQRDNKAADRGGRTLVTNTFRFALGQIAGLNPQP